MFKRDCNHASEPFFDKMGGKWDINKQLIPYINASATCCLQLMQVVTYFISNSFDI